MKAMLSETEKQFLLHVARNSIECAIRNAHLTVSETVIPSLIEPSGAFVTLRIGNKLRGCIGYIDAVKPLLETVEDAATKSALDDIRFLPVEPEELPNITIEISVISPIVPIRSIDEIEIGKHGLVIVYGTHRGLLLPQVAVEHGWDRETFLSQTARKAGLPLYLWKDPEAKLFSFTAEVFSEQPTAVHQH
ncbi:MAG: AmmeMemoRadiSam system protein A [Ignavibacteria bacterium]|nr:AmmeMemoRadiSam system protein A [Ignavibacteria bacterium]MBI3765589.1 AmmeMemoRadiSam system protein A [Ignavibacteriales bacterium]